MFFDKKAKGGNMGGRTSRDFAWVFGFWVVSDGLAWAAGRKAQFLFVVLSRYRCRLIEVCFSGASSGAVAERLLLLRVTRSLSNLYCLVVLCSQCEVGDG